jgi:phosphoribosylanthranilate isomerase
MMVKICGITTREDAVAAADAGASALGLNFYRKSPRFITPEEARAVAAGLPVLKVGVFVDEPPEAVAAIAEQAELDIVQLHGSELPGRYRGRVWKAVRVTPSWSAASIGAGAEAWLLDGPAPGTGASFDWSRAQGVEARIILAGGLDDTNVAAAIQAVRPWGVDACSRLEIAPGRKDMEKVKRFIEAALAA